MRLEIRPVDYDHDLPELAAMLDRVMTAGMSVSRLREGQNNPAPINRNMVATDDIGAIVGWYMLIRGENEPSNRAFTSLIVHPEHRGDRIGTALFDDLTAFCKTVGVSNLKARVKDSEPEWLAWAESKGFTIDRHSFRSSITLADFDVSPFENAISELKSEGIVFTTLAELGDTETNRRLYYEADCKAAIDVPGEDSVETWEEYYAENFGSEDYRAEGAFIAMDGELMIGVAHVWLDKEHDRMGNAFTGVIPEFRGRGIATALKVLTILHAKEVGVSEILTENDSENGPMLAVNGKLGYKRWPGAYMLKATIAK
ncbi:MAG: GNAT family N-acetyltransferase [Dehalococcoidia bacterium]